MAKKKKKNEPGLNGKGSNGCRAHLIQALREDDPKSVAVHLKMCEGKRNTLRVPPSGRPMLANYNLPWEQSHTQPSIVRAMDNEFCHRLTPKQGKGGYASLPTLLLAIGARFGCSRVVEMLLSDAFKGQVNLAYDERYALRMAIENGHVKIANLLLTDRRMYKSASLDKAFAGARHLDMVKLILHDQRATSASLNQVLCNASPTPQNCIDANKTRYKTSIPIETILPSGPLQGVTNAPHAISQEASYVEKIEIAKLLLSDKREVNPAFNNCRALHMACISRHVELVSLLLSDSRVDPSIHFNAALRQAVMNGEENDSQARSGRIVKLLLTDPRTDPSVNRGELLRQAIKRNDAATVEALLQDKRIDASDKSNGAIAWAASRGHTTIVKMLVKDKRVNLAVKDQYPLRHAIKQGYVEIIKLLLSDQRVVITPTIIRLADSPICSARGFRSVLAVRPPLWPELTKGNGLRCKTIGNVRMEFDLVEKETSRILLLCVNRYFSPTIAGRVADVMRDVCKEWSPFLTDLCGDSADLTYQDISDLKTFSCGSDWLNSGDLDFHSNYHNFESGWPNFESDEEDEDEEEYHALANFHMGLMNHMHGHEMDFFGLINEMFLEMEPAGMLGVGYDEDDQYIFHGGNDPWLYE